VKILLQTFSYTTKLWPYYIGITLATLLATLAGLATPFLIKDATDLVVKATTGGGADVRGALMIAFYLFLFDIGGFIVRNIGGYLGDQMSEKLRVQLSVRYYQQLLSLSQSYYDDQFTGTIISRLNRAITEIVRFTVAFTNNFFQMFLTAILTIAIVAFYSWQLALLVFSLYPIFGWLTTRSSKKWQRLQHEKNDHIDMASGRFAEVVSQIRVVKSYVSERLELKSFSSHFNKTIDLNVEQSRHWHIMDVKRGGVLALVFFGIAVLIFTETVQGQFTVGEMVLLVTLINAVRMPIFMMSYIVDQYQRAVTGSREFVEVMLTKPAIVDVPRAKALKVPKGEIAFDAVDFSYDGEAPVLKSISFRVHPGQKLALVGKSGEGKSTISNLLMRLYEPSKGAILIDGTDIAAVTQSSLRKNIATVFQDPALFSGTIKENIAYGNPKASDEAIIKAAKAASADEFITDLKDGYDSVVGERGIKLSGGQKQRISIARALLKDAPILILDEATSSLDSRSEHLVQGALNRLMKGGQHLLLLTVSVRLRMLIQL
jgi:ATP-binding cassette subfamily B protein